MNNQELKRELNRTQAMVVAFGGGITLLIAAMMLLLTSLVDSASVTVQSPGTVLWAATFGILLVGLGILIPYVGLAWDWWRDRNPTDGGVA